MTRSEAYAEGFQEGRRWAEGDISDHVRLDPVPVGGDAWSIGAVRGYRDTWARYEAGTLTREMFEHAPRGGSRA